jgi:ATP-dependent Zn protease
MLHYKSISFLFSFLLILLNANSNAQIQGQTSLSKEDRQRAYVLAHHEKSLLQQLDQSKATIQYLLQILKTKEDQEEHRAVRNWLATQLRTTSNLQRTPLIPITEEKLYTLGYNINVVIDQLANLLDKDNNLAKVPEALPQKSLPLENITVDTIEEIVQDNAFLLEDIKAHVAHAGLTKWNIFFQYLDKVPSLSTMIAISMFLTVVANIMPEYVLGTDRWLVEPHRYLHIPVPIENPPATLGYIGWFAWQSPRIFTALTMFTTFFDKLPLSMQKEYKGNMNDLYREWSMKWAGYKGSDDVFIPSSYETIENITLDDPNLVGVEEQKELLWSIVNYLLDPELYIRQRVNMPKARILIGPSRSGKSLIIRALLGTLNQIFAQRGSKKRVLFRKIMPHELMQEGAIKQIIDDAKRKGWHCVLFFEEFHTLGIQTHQDRIKLADALNALDELHQSNDPEHQVFVFAATNRPDLIDPAFLKYERFGKPIRFSLPTFALRKQFFTAKIKSIMADPQDFNLDEFARQTEGASYGDLQEIFNTARLATNNIESLKHHHFTNALNKTFREIMDNKIPAEPHTKRLIAAHQAGHALAHILLAPKEILDLVTICATGQKILEVNEWSEVKASDRKIKQHDEVYGACFMHHDDEQMPSLDQHELHKKISLSVSGKIAEDTLLGTHSLSYHESDTAQAFDYAKRLLLDGLVENDLSKENARKIAHDAQQLVKEAETKMRELFTQHQYTLHTLAQSLEDKHSLTSAEIMALMAQANQSA